MTYAQKTISKFGLETDPRHIEAYMRLQYGTLDHLSREEFAKEAAICNKAALQDPDAAERLAESYGL